jgi:putative serine protease PepD
MSPILRPSRTAATLSAALLLGAGGGAAAALAVDSGSTTATRVPTSAAAAPAVSASSRAAGMTVNDVYRRAKQGVVDIKVTTGGSAGGPPGAPGQGSATAEGSGFVIDKDGDIVTNQHVVDGARSIEVTFADGTKASAKVVGADGSSDLAVIRVSGVDSSVLQPLTLGDSSKAAVGNGVIAIGSPYGLAGSVTAGVVSALGRSITAPNHYTIAGAIQTDAPINHGNSGGPLLDSTGDVIGVNAQIESDSGENTGVGFAIPSNTVKSVAAQIIAGGRVSHPYLGLQLTDGEAGATVSAATSGGPAANAGVRSGDVVTAIDGKSMASSDELVSAVQAHRVGDKVTLTVRRGGSTEQVGVTLGNQAAS